MIHKCACVTNCGRTIEARDLRDLPASAIWLLDRGHRIFISNTCVNKAPEGYKLCVNYSCGSTWREIK